MINLQSLESLGHGALHYVGWFLVILTLLVFVHEFGHYFVARWNGVRVEVFSIGFGPELFGRRDRAGTRWKFSAIPLGGYIKMLGESDPVAAGPAANFLFAVVVLAILFVTFGRPFTPPVVGQVQPGSAAEQAGIRAG